MPKLLMLQGLPGSGKTTYAKELETQGWHRVNKDDIRRWLESGGWTWSHENEKQVVEERDKRISTALAIGQDVVSDDTNFGRKHKVALAKIATDFGAKFEIKKFDTPIDVCIERDSKREGKARVGEKVIRDMASRYQLLGVPPVGTTANGKGPVELVTIEKVDPVKMRGLPSVLICDLDGTLARFDGKRSPYDAASCENDDIDIPVLTLLRTYHYHLGHLVLLVSGREDKHRDATVRWLAKHQIPYHALWMRKSGDFRKDFLVKYEIFNEHIRNSYDVELVLDDRNQVVDMWRKLGLKCFQVEPGDF